MNWPTKEERENFEINGFIAAYKQPPQGRSLTTVSKHERPDWIVADTASGEELGVELTSVYLDDRSVPDNHISWSDGEIRNVPYSKETMHQYKGRIISAIADKIRKAETGYDTSRPLILAIYINEYIGIYLDKDELDQLVKDNEALFDNMAPFSEIAFWALGNGAIYRVRPS